MTTHLTESQADGDIAEIPTNQAESEAIGAAIGALPETPIVDLEGVDEFDEWGGDCGTTGVYALAHPITGHVVYIGQSRQIESRVREHFEWYNASRNRGLYDWALRLAREGLTPRLVILVKCGRGRLNRHETRLIREHYDAGGCDFNKAAGGHGNGIKYL